MPSDHHDVESAIRLIARARGISVTALRRTIQTLATSSRPDPSRLAVRILTKALASMPLRVEAPRLGKPITIDLVAEKPFAFGEGVVVGDVITAPGFEPVTMDRGQCVRAVVYKTGQRISGLATFTAKPPIEPYAYDVAFFVLTNEEERVWQVNARELAHVARDIEAGAAWHRIRRLKSGALRLEFPMRGSDFDLGSRAGRPPVRGPQ